MIVALSHWRCAAASLALSLAGLAATPASAAPFTSGTYWSESKKCSLTANSCLLQFTSIHVSKKLSITDISCSVEHEDTTARLAPVRLSTANGGFFFFPAVRVSEANEFASYAFAARTNRLVNSGNGASVLIKLLPDSRSVFLDATCTISGIYVNAS